MKALDIALKDLTQALRSAIALVFMFGIPIGVTGLFYVMMGAGVRSGSFELQPIALAVANLDQEAPHLPLSRRQLPEGVQARTLSELLVGVLSGPQMSRLLAVTVYPSAEAARQAVDTRQAQIALIIPPGFARQFYEPFGQTELELYQDPTLTLGPGVVKAIIAQFMDTLSGMKISTDLVLDELNRPELGAQGARLIQSALQELLEIPTEQTRDPVQAFLEVRSPRAVAEEPNSLKTILGPILCALIAFYAFYTGTATAESILREEERGTLPRLFSTPTPQSVILSGKFLAVLLTVGLQIGVTLLAGQLLFQMHWGAPAAVAAVALGLVMSASAFGICVNSFLKDTRQSGAIFGGLLTMTGMVGMIRVFGMGNPDTQGLTQAVSQLVPQGWAIRGMLQAMGGEPLSAVLLSSGVMLAWAALFFAIGLLRFRRRYL